MLILISQLQYQGNAEHRHYLFFLVLKQNPLCSSYVVTGKLSLFLRCAIDKPMTSVKQFREWNKRKSLLETRSSIYLCISYLTLNICFSTNCIMKIVKFPKKSKSKSYCFFRCIAKQNFWKIYVYNFILLLFLNWLCYKRCQENVSFWKIISWLTSIDILCSRIMK